MAKPANRDQLYGRRWRKLRRLYLDNYPLCAMCERQGHLRAATEVDHIRKHDGDPALFFDWHNLQGLCALHHRSTKARQERSGTSGAIDAAGEPMDAEHHWHDGVGGVGRWRGSADTERDSRFLLKGQNAQ